MGARTKLNSAYVKGALALAGMAALITGSATVFVVTVVVLVGASIVAGDIRTGGGRSGPGRSGPPKSRR